MWRILYPMNYFRLSNAEKRHIDLFPTFILAIIIALPFFILKDASFFRPNGFLDKVLTLTAALTGFYVAALVAAATFSHPDLDKVIKAGPIALITKDSDGHRIKEYLTRREFACLIFGYLAFLSLLISMLSAFFIAISGASFERVHEIRYLGVIFSNGYIVYTRGVLLFTICLMVSHLMTATLLGLYYLMDRLYRHDRQITTKKPNSEAA
jgi:hypothetical protein